MVWVVEVVMDGWMMDEWSNDWVGEWEWILFL